MANASNTHTISFCECEHDGDLNAYCDDLRASGATIIDANIDYDNDRGLVTITVSNLAAFKVAFADTDAAAFRTSRL